MHGNKINSQPGMSTLSASGRCWTLSGKELPVATHRSVLAVVLYLPLTLGLGSQATVFATNTINRQPAGKDWVKVQ